MSDYLPYAIGIACVVVGVLVGVFGPKLKQMIKLPTSIPGQGAVMNYLPHAIIGIICLASGLIVGVTGIKIDHTVTSAAPLPIPPDVPTPPEPGPAPPNPGPPGPGPTPPPTPDPGPNDGRFGVARLVWTSAKQLARPGETAALGAEFANLAGYIRQNNPGLLTIIGVPGVRDGLLQEYLGKAIPTSSRAAWQPFGDILKAAIKTAYSAGKLPDSAAWADCFDEVSLGLKAVK